MAVRTKVLVIDDEPSIRLLCRVNLEAEGMEVFEAADGQAGLELARAESPDVIVLDVTLPRLDGWQVAEELLDDERTRSAAIVFLTGWVELGERARALGLHGVEYVTKPFDPFDLGVLVRGLLEDPGGGERLQRETIAQLRAFVGR